MEKEQYIKKEKSILTAKRFFIALGIVLSASLLTYFSQRVLTLNSSFGNDYVEATQDVHFQILSVPPTEVFVDSEYTYYLRFGQFDSQEVYVSVVHKPDWLRWDAEKLKLSGTPSAEYIGPNYVVLQVTDLDDIKEQAFTIQVTPLETPEVDIEEDSVKGTQTVASTEPTLDSYRLSREEDVATLECQRLYNEIGPLGMLSEHTECEGVFYGGRPLNANKDVLGIESYIPSEINGVSSITEISSLKAARADNRLELFGYELGTTSEIGIIASLSVVLLGLLIVFFWTLMATLRMKKSSDQEGSGRDKKAKKQQSFIESDKKTRVIIWD